MTDRQLVDCILTGDSELYSEVVRRHTSAVFSATLSLTKRRELAMELTQQTFVRAYERLANFRSDNLKGWLLSVAYNLTFSTLSQERRRRASPIEDTDAVADEDFSEEREQQLQRMEQAIEQLPATDRDIIRLHYFERLTTKQISERKEMTQSNVLVRLSRIREQLRKQIDTDETD